VTERELMCSQMLQPFLGLNLEDGLTRCIGDLELCCTESRSASIGPFGVFDSNVNVAQPMSPEPEETLVDNPGVLLLDLILKASSVFSGKHIIPGQHLPPQTEHEILSEILNHLHPAGIGGEGMMIVFFTHTF
jgi:hypothetical protein